MTKQKFNPMGKKWIVGFTLFLAFMGSLIPAGLGEASHAARNLMCPVMKGEHTKDKFFAEHEGKRVYFCCRSCVNKFKKKPTKYLALLEKA